MFCSVIKDVLLAAAVVYGFYCIFYRLFVEGEVCAVFDGDKLERAEGVVERVIYQNSENGYGVVELCVDEAEFLTIVGTLPFVAEGETITAFGTFTIHPQFGRQLKVEYYEKKLPATEGTILKYLSSRTIKGIGPAAAKKIVEQFGTDTFDVIENHPQYLAQINGISETKAQMISEEFKKQFGVRSVMMFCRDFFSPSVAVRIYKKWGGSAVDLIKQNPYILCDEIFGVGFEKADEIAKTVGISRHDSERICAGLKYILQYNANRNGHVYIPQEKLLKAAVRMLHTEREETEDALDSLLASEQLYRVKDGSSRRIYLRRYYLAEKCVADRLIMLEDKKTAVGINNLKNTIDITELSEGIKYAPAQREAIALAVNSGVMVLTGGPGTGKTTIIKAVLRIFDQMGYKTALAAPTGRAAKRMSEATLCEAKTLHRLLEMEYSEDMYPRFIRCESNLLDENVIIVDEASMIDIILAEALVKAIKPGAKLILIGDADQLPSVGAGDVLRDIIKSERFNTVHLTEIFRQAKQSLIITNAHAINNGKYPDLQTKTNDFFYIKRESDEDIAKTVATLCKSRLPRTYGESVVRDIQVITPSRKGYAGTEMLNTLLQGALNPPSSGKRERKSRSFVFREGDKVMQIKNNYNITWVKNDVDGIGVFNGDIGTITKIDPGTESVTILFDEREAVYDFTMLDELEHAYAVTVHKSQGSEYPIIILPAYQYTSKLLTRNLLYTAVTRAQRMVIIVGRSDVICKMVDNNRQTMRYTSLARLLSDYSQ